MTADQYLALGETPERYELIDGVIMMSPSPSPAHQRLISQILFQLESHAGQTGSITVFPDTDIRLGDHLVYRPDLAVYRSSRLPRIPRRLTEPPDLVIEVLSPGSRPLDLVTKRGDYERFGVGEYWVVDAETGAIRCWTRSGAGFEEAAVDPGAERLQSAAAADFALDLAPIRRIIAQAEA